MDNKPFIPPPPSGLKKENIEEQKVENLDKQQFSTEQSVSSEQTLTNGQPFSSEKTPEENKSAKADKVKNAKFNKRKKIENANKSNLINWIGFALSTAALILFVYLLFI